MGNMGRTLSEMVDRRGGEGRRRSLLMSNWSAGLLALVGAASLAASFGIMVGELLRAAGGH